MVVCSECGCKNIEVRAWVDANTNKFISDFEDTDGWCQDCGEHMTFVDEKDFDDDYTKRQKRIDEEFPS